VDATIEDMPDTGFDTQYERFLKPKLLGLQRRGRRWLMAFWILVLAGWGLAMWVLFTESLSLVWLLPFALAIPVTGLVLVGEVNGLKQAFSTEVLGKLYGQVFPQCRHDPDGQIEAEALQRSGLFSTLFGRQRRIMHDRLDGTYQDLPLTVCAADICIPGENENNKPAEKLFAGTLFVLQMPLNLKEPVVLVCGNAEPQPIPPALDLARMQQVGLGHPTLDKTLRVWCSDPGSLKAALPPQVVRALAEFCSRHSQSWRVVLDDQGMVGGLDGDLLSDRIHPRLPLPDAGVVRAEVQRVQNVLDLVSALTGAASGESGSPLLK
jgi:hypothetical protein